MAQSRMLGLMAQGQQLGGGKEQEDRGRMAALVGTQAEDKVYANKRIQQLAPQIYQGDQAAVTEAAGLDPTMTNQIMGIRNNMDAKDKQIFNNNLTTMSAEIGNIKSPEEWDAYMDNLAQLGYSGAEQYKGKWTPEYGQTLQNQFNHMQKLMGPGKDDRTTSMKKTQELMNMGVPPEIASGMAYGAFRQQTDPSTGMTMVIDVRTGQPIGGMVPVDPNDPYGPTKWQPSASYYGGSGGQQKQEVMSSDTASKQATKYVDEKASLFRWDSTDFGDIGRSGYEKLVAQAYQYGTTPPPTYYDYAQAAKKANPGATDEQIQQRYKSRYWSNQ